MIVRRVLLAISCLAACGAAPGGQGRPTVVTTYGPVVGRVEGDLYSDMFIVGVRSVVRAHAAIQKDTYLYQFTRTSEAAKGSALGCFHGIELPYLFGTFPKRWQLAQADQQLARTMRRYWVSFARSGSPNAGSLPDWPRYTAAEDRHLILDEPIGSGKHLRKRHCDFLEKR
jgi:carboxylesterase type B